ncbi:MAG: NAD(P)/FAD-dependent oxidoreductase [Actinomycetota bacterium]
MRYVIIGSSAAGIQAAEELRKLEGDSRIKVISKEGDYPYSRCLISRMVDGRLAQKNLYFKTGHFFKDKNIESSLGKEIVSIDRKQKIVTDRNGKDTPYDKLLLATGSSPWLPDIEGLDLEGVYTFHTLKDARDISFHLGTAKKAVILGAGFIGLEAAYALTRKGVEVTVVEKTSQVLPKQADATAATIIQKDLEDLGVNIIFDESVSSIDGRQQVTGVSLMDKSHIQCDMVIIATGVLPNTGIAQKAGLETDKGLIVDEYFRTSDPDIHGAGDVIEISDISTGKRDVSATWFNAVLHGKFAGYNMADYKRRYTGAVGIQNAVQFHQIPVISYGKTLLETEEEQKEYEVLSIHKGKVYKKLVLKGNRICGMNFVTDILKSGFYAALIRHRVDIGKYKDKLLDDDFSYAYFKDYNFGEYSPYFKVPQCWESSDWWTHRLECQQV